MSSTNNSERNKQDVKRPLIMTEAESPHSNGEESHDDDYYYVLSSLLFR